jgi:4-carboxymuconolactone decarboxylase
MTGSRLRRLRPTELSPRQARVYAEITGGPRGATPPLFSISDDQGALLGPFNAMLFAPEVGDALQALGSALRFESGLPGRLREAVILVVASRLGSAFERYAHEAVGRDVGLTESEIDRLRQTPVGVVFDDPGEQAVLQLADRQLSGDEVDDQLYAAAAATLTERGLVEITTLVGYYSMLAQQMKIFAADFVPSSEHVS